jgi:competence protein ComFB
MDMDIHNTNEDLVFNLVQKTFDEIQHSGNPDKFCLCYQCRVDTICFVLNRIEPHYIVSNRGLTRIIDPVSINNQQVEADITTLIYKGIRLVNHNLRPTAPHDGTAATPTKIYNPLFDIPTISGRIFNGKSFEPITGIEVSLYCEGELDKMRNNNWQNPYTMVASTPGVFSFWPAQIIADNPEVTQDFKFSLRVTSPDYETMTHFFNITSTSKFHTSQSYALNRTYKLPDLYIFPPGSGDEENQE